jgi:hypothetical protein
MFSDDKITNIFYLTDEFCKIFESTIKKSLIKEKTDKRIRNRKYRMSDSEVITILILFHLSDFTTLKHFYCDYVVKHMQKYFPKTVSYNRFTELQPKVAMPLTLLLKTKLLGKCTGISFVDSTPLRVCRNQRIRQNKTFEGLAQRGHCSMGWFYGFKLHLICNDKGEILNFVFTQGNIDDREPLHYENFMKKVKGKLFADRGYISQLLFNNLFVDGIQLITKVKKNMVNCVMSLRDKILLRKRAIIESVNDELKNNCKIEHSRHRCFAGFITNAVAAIAAYCCLPKKPSLNLQFESPSNQLSIF